jgi:hypothetical protein
MATKQFYAIKPFKFANRMMTAGDPVQMDGPTARLYTALNAISPNKPRTVTSLARPDADGSGQIIPATVATAPPVTPPPAVPTAPTATRKAAPRKRTAKKRATAKK